jgi:ATP-dependent exoDNAse (exonuclease V), alpha subunit - helicase superfamily I member
LKKEFSKALKENIIRTFSYAFAKNTARYQGHSQDYDAIELFTELLNKENPFKVFMELDNHNFKMAKRQLLSYGIPYREDEERVAKIYEDVTSEMNNQRSDYVTLFNETDLKNSGVVVFKPPYTLTTEKTIFVRDGIDRLPKEKEVFNRMVDVPKTIKDNAEQFQALQTSLKYQVSCVIGGAGTGKSHVTAEIIRQFVLNDKKVAVLAPTHKAREALQSKIKVKVEVQTIHKFTHNPKECDVIVIDESGMLSTPLMAALLGVYSGEQLVFVGDKNQLEPIEYGRPFERIQELFPKTELKNNMRSEARDVIGLGREILGEPQNANLQIENIENVSTAKEAFEKGAEVLLSFTNKAVQETNEQQRLKNTEPAISPNFSVGDVIVAKTNETGQYYNGQLFRLTEYNKAVQVDQEQHIVVFDTPNDLYFNFDLAYGLTIHKSQGSEWDCVAYQPSSMDYRNLAYVAVTRAKKKLFIVGDGIRLDYPPQREWRHIV